MPWRCSPGSEQNQRYSDLNVVRHFLHSELFASTLFASPEIIQGLGEERWYISAGCPSNKIALESSGNAPLPQLCPMMMSEISSNGIH